ncbi:hypothetical protein PENTCL1PPCAC_27476, partial [Pristionchus entomophagus]
CTMPRKAANAPIPAPTRSRRSAGVTEFLSLDLYSSARKVEKAVNVFKADENHNGIKVEQATINQSSAVNVTPVAPKKRRHAKTQVVSPPADMPNKSHSRPSSVTSSVQTMSSVVVVPPKKRRGKTGLKMRKMAKSPERRGTVAKSPNDGRASSVETMSPVPVVAPKRGRSEGKMGAAQKRVARGRTPAKGKAPAKTKTTIKQEILSDEEMQEEIPVIKNDMPVIKNEPDDEIEVKPDTKALRSMGTSGDASRHKRLRSAISENAIVNNSQLSLRRQKDLVLRLEEMVSCATTMTLVNYDNVIRNLTVCEKSIKEIGELLNPDSDLQDLQDKVASLEGEKMEWQRDKTVWMNEKNRLNKTVDERQSEVERAQKKVKEMAEEKDNQQKEMKEEKARLQKEIQHLKVQLDATAKPTKSERSSAASPSTSDLQKEVEILKAQLDAIATSAATARSSAVSTSSSTSRFDRYELPGPPDEPPTRPANNNQLTRQNLLRGVAVPAVPSYDLEQMPKGSAVGRTEVAGRANQLITGLNHVAGMDEAMASVAITAATIPETDEHGNVMQRTFRTRVERIAVTDGMSVQELERLGYVITHTGETTEEEDDEDEDEEEDEDEMEEQNQRNRMRVEEMKQDEDGYSENGEEGLPLIEEAE